MIGQPEVQQALPGLHLQLAISRPDPLAVIPIAEAVSAMQGRIEVARQEPARIVVAHQGRHRHPECLWLARYPCICHRPFVPAAAVRGVALLETAGEGDLLAIDEEDAVLLRWAAYLHEIGLAISHSGYHRHSAYLLAHSDVDGFSQVDKIRVSQLVQYHRRKIKSESYEEINMIGGKALVYLCLLLRLAVLLHHSRGKQENPPILLTAHDEKNWTITILPEYEGKNLLLVDLQEEQDAFAKWGVELTVESDVNA